MALPEIRTRIRVLCQEEVISLQSSAQAEGPLTRFLRPGPGEGLEKQGRIERVKERKERGRGERSIKSLVPYQTWPVVHVRRRPGTKGSLLRLLGLVHWQAIWPLSTPSGQDVSLSFFTNNDRFCALDLKSEKWSVIRDKGVEVACPMITEKNTGDKMNTQRAETMRHSHRHDKQITNTHRPRTQH